MLLYNKLLKVYKDTNYPFNLIDNLKDNIINTRNEIELEYIKDLNIFQDKEDKKKEIKLGGGYSKKIYIYEY